MPNRSHYNPGHRMMNYLRKAGRKHSSERDLPKPLKTIHAVLLRSGIEVIRDVPDNRVNLVLCDPPYNLSIGPWDRFDNYLGWARTWLDEIPRVLNEAGNFVLFGGFQFQNERGGDLVDILHYMKYNSTLRFVNLIVWHYKSGMGAHRFFSNRHEEIAWFAKTSKYTFNLDTVRLPYDEKTKKEYRKDTRLNPETIEKGKNPTNVWSIPRLNANSKERVGHVTQKPSELVRRIVRALTQPGDIVLDPFAGAGTSLAVCIEEGRHSITCDLDPKFTDYCEAQLSRISNDMFITPFTVLRETDFGEHPIFK